MPSPRPEARQAHSLEGHGQLKFTDAHHRVNGGDIYSSDTNGPLIDIPQAGCKSRAGTFLSYFQRGYFLASTVIHGLEG